MRHLSRATIDALLVPTTALAGPSGAAQAADEPALSVTVIEDGLQNPWDLTVLPATGSLPAGAMLYTERSRKTVTLRLPDGTQRTVLDSPDGMWAAGETGLMAIEADRDFATTRSFATCHGYVDRGKPEVRVVRWKLDADFTRASFERNLVIHLPATSGRHGGCALVKGGGTSLYVGTGDAAVGTNPQKITSGGGKVMRIDMRTGAPWSGNPWRSVNSWHAKKTYTTGHRNVQGLARRADGRIFSAEHGSGRDDEVNLLGHGANYGWNPVPRKTGDPSYNEGTNSPMTDHGVPGIQQNAKWRSGTPTIAISGIDFVRGSRWGSLDGALATGVLKGQQLRLLHFSASGALQGSYVPPELDGEFGRLRAVVAGPDGALYVTTSNGSDDKILRVTPAG